MAKADDTISNWIRLHEALKLAVTALGSRALAEKWLRQWLTAGELPWKCMDWEGLDDEGLAKLRQSLEGSGIMLLAPSAAYYNGDPRFWVADLEINWEDSTARESAPMTPNGAQALGIKVPLARLRELLPAGPHENEEAAPRQAKPAEPEKLDPKGWLAWARKEFPKQRNERSGDYTRRLHGLMEKADNVTEVWVYPTFRVRWYEAVKADRHAPPIGEPK